MAQTKSERLLSQIGKIVECDICHEKVIMGHNWLMTGKREAVCPKCQPALLKSDGLLVTI